MEVQKFQSWVVFVLLSLILVFFLVLIFFGNQGCGKHQDPVVGPQGPTGATGPPGATGPTGETGSTTRTGFHVITFGDPEDTSAPNSGGLLVNDMAVWDTITTVPGVITVRIPGTKHPDDVTEVFLGGGSRGLLRYRFEASN